MKPILITSYVNPDLDGVASMMAYAEFLQTEGTNAVAGIIGAPQVEAEYLLRRFGIPPPESILNADAFDEVILVDASSPNDVESTISAEKVMEIIDHRSSHEADAFPNAKARIELVGAAATLIAEKFIRRGIEPSKESAVLLCGGIISNTLDFRGSMTTERDTEAFEWLNRIAQLPEGFWRELFAAKSDVAGDTLAERIRGDFKWFDWGRTRVGIAEIEMLGVGTVLHEREDEIVRILGSIKDEKQLDLIFLNAIELEDPRTFVVAPETRTQQVLQDALQARFVGTIAELSQVLMRKQIVPLLKESVR